MMQKGVFIIAQGQDLLAERAELVTVRSNSLYISKFWGKG